ncbi:MAG TPA: histidine phosphatase family protein [Thermoplasmata archaeon]|nr:histidine phosphatase family protein [Thermoplasmata archaeon]
MADPTLLFLIRHGEIDRPPVAQFDDAVLTDRGRQQIHSLALQWKHAKPDLIYCSPLPRSVETASVFAAVQRRPIHLAHDLKEWSATDQDVPQETYIEWERRCWADFNHQNDDGESLHHATDRILGFLTTLGGRHRGRPVMISGHAILFALFRAAAFGERATEDSKNRIQFGAYAILEYDGDFRIAREFAP